MKKTKILRGQLVRACSAIALGTFATHAYAECTPDPTVPSGETSCTGTDTDGIAVTTNYSIVSVAEGASVSNTGGPAIAVAIAPNSDGYYYSSLLATISVDGSVNGGDDAGISVIPGQADLYGSTSSIVTISDSGIVSGNNGIVAQSTANYSDGNSTINVDNAGTIIGTGGAALASTGDYAGFSSVTNRVGGTIGGIAAAIGTLDNSGTIDGGALSAIDVGSDYVSNILVYPWTNTGQILSSSSATTISTEANWSLELSNSGTIRNSGTGAAIVGNYVTLENSTTGQIASAGPTAILAKNLQLTNSGTITGDVVTNGIDGGSTIDSTSSTITGNVTFGGGADTLFVRYTGSPTVTTGISGSINGGSGIDTMSVRVTEDTTVDTSISLIYGFEYLGFDVADDTTVTLADNFTTDKTISVTGNGTLENKGVIAAVGQALIASSFGSPTIVNRGTINTTTAVFDRFAINVGTARRFENAGTVTAAGDGVYGGGEFVNAGSITASGVGVSLSPITFNNSGTILSTGGTAAILSGSSAGSINTGVIQGKTGGVDLSDLLINSGTIKSDGIAVILRFGGEIQNLEGGVIEGGAVAIGLPGSNTYETDRVVVNAGTINGDVLLAGSDTTTYSTNNQYFALSGGVLNGNLTLGKGDTLIAEIENEGSSRFAGITGTVTAAESRLLYEVRADTDATLTSEAGFSSLGYQLHDGAALELTAEDPVEGLITFAGCGSVDLTADINASAQPAILRAYLVSPDGYLPGDADGPLSITSNGAITLTRTDSNSYAYAAVSTGSSFTNTGTITVTDTSDGTYGSLAGVAANDLTNSGTISVNVGEGVRDWETVDNSGTIMAGGAALAQTYFFATATNSGLLESTQSAAVITGYSTTIDNLSGGTITGGAGVAIQGSGGTISNAGTINGGVDLGYSSYGYSANTGTYIAAGGSLDGDLRFGSGSDLLIETGAGLGVTGTIDGGEGTDFFGHQRSESGTVTLGGDLPANFEKEFTAAIGADTIATITTAAPYDGDLYIGGDGQIVNQASVEGSVLGLNYINFYPSPYDNMTLGSFSNEGHIAGNVSLTVESFSNSGTIGSTDMPNSTAQQYGTDKLSFANTGTINAHVTATGYALNNASVDNIGTLASGAELSLEFDPSGADLTATIDNSGTISGSGLQVYTSESYSEDGGLSPFTISIANSGLLENTYVANFALRASGPAEGDLAVSNTGTIRANEGGFVLQTNFDGASVAYGPHTLSAVAIRSYGDTTISNDATGVIEATGALSTAILIDGALKLTNAGTIEGTGYSTSADDLSVWETGLTTVAGAIQTIGDGDDWVDNSGTIIGSISLEAGNDFVSNSGTIDGNVSLGDGDDGFTMLLSATLGGIADGGTGSDTLVTDVTGGGTLNSAYFAKFANFENFAITGSGSVATNGILPVQSLRLEDGASFTLAEGSTLQTQGPVALTGTGGAEQVINKGIIIGDVALGGGNDSFEVYAGSSVSGNVDGGDGSDRLAFHFANTREPRPIELGGYTSFEQLALTGGIGSLSGNVAFDTIAVDAGRLIGLAGSMITAPQGISVAAGATFGSAGTVNADIVVNGTLSPGASPGTMTVNGEVTLASGSTTVFEMTPTVSDALVIDGDLTIADGTTLQITGERPLTPGVTYQLISTTDGISGSFSSISKASTVLGFLRQTADALELLGTLQLRGTTPIVTDTTDYLNSLLIDGTATEGIYDALPELVDASGYADAARINSLSPEAYATAGQIGADNGLAIAAAVRAAQQTGNGQESGFFAIGQGLANWHNVRGDAAIGTAEARQDFTGFLGGIGYLAGPVSLTLYGGRISGDQTIRAIGAHNDAEGTFVGVGVGFAQGGADLGASLTWDDSSIDTSRTLYDGTTAKAGYDLHTLTFDSHAGYGLPVGQGWRLGPQVGFTHITVKRGEAEETGASAFALDVVSRKESATFFTADIRLDAAPDVQLRPWLSVGWQKHLAGDLSVASASFAGVSSQFTVPGAERERSFASVEAGFDWAASSNIRLFGRAGSQFNGHTDAKHASLGVRVGW